MKKENRSPAPNTEEMGTVFNPGKESAMTEIVAAHLERVARETAEKWLGPEPYVPAMASGASWVSTPFEATFTIKPHTQLVGELTALVAAALAACARERDEQLLKAAKATLAEMEDYERHLQLQVFSTKEALRAVLERA